MDIHQLYALIKKYREHRCSPDELQQLNHWYEQFDEEAERIPAVPGEKLEYLFVRIEQKIETGNAGKNRFRTVIRWVGGIAALVAISLMAGRYFISPNEEIALPNEIIASFQPGCRQAELTLEDGSKISLSDMTVVKDRDGHFIKKDSSSVLDYTALPGADVRNSFNMIAVPMGGEYSVILADGTQVWLNSGSSLKYPVVFGDDKREVILNGEAFFKVSKLTIPFIVKTPDLDIRVLGTSFNVSAYENDDCVSTALVNGSVIVSGNHGHHNYRLEPGYVLSYVKSTTRVTVEECDTDLYTSWMDGEFKFRDMRLEDIMTKLNRWYNCQVIYEDKSLKDLRFSGSAERDRPADYLLGLIEIITRVSFEMKGDTIIVRKR